MHSVPEWTVQCSPDTCSYEAQRLMPDSHCYHRDERSNQKANILKYEQELGPMLMGNVTFKPAHPPSAWELAATCRGVPYREVALAGQFAPSNSFAKATWLF
jgi:hypothetical protein